MKDIFVSYRRSDSSDVTGRIFDKLKARFGDDRLFKDVDSIPLGKDFRKVIAEAVGQCQVLLAVIGNDWCSASDEQGGRRINSSDDYVHIELATALERKIPVIPVLVEHTAMPRVDDLPQQLQDLAYRNAIPVRPDPDFHNDMNRLCDQLGAYIDGSRSGTRRAHLRRIAAVAALVILIVGVTVVSLTGWPPKLVDESASALNSGGEPDMRPAASSTEPVTAPIPMRYWIEKLPDVLQEDPEKLFSNALGSWQSIITAPIREADSQAEANVIISTDSQGRTYATVGPPSAKKRDLVIKFSDTNKWTPRAFEAASCRMLGHVLGLEYTATPGQVMSDYRLINSDPSKLPLTPQAEDVRRIREIWGD